MPRDPHSITTPRTGGQYPCKRPQARPPAASPATPASPWRAPAWARRNLDIASPAVSDGDPSLDDLRAIFAPPAPPRLPLVAWWARTRAALALPLLPWWEMPRVWQAARDRLLDGFPGGDPSVTRRDSAGQPAPGEGAVTRPLPPGKGNGGLDHTPFEVPGLASPAPWVQRWLDRQAAGPPPPPVPVPTLLNTAPIGAQFDTTLNGKGSKKQRRMPPLSAAEEKKKRRAEWRLLTKRKLAAVASDLFTRCPPGRFRDLLQQWALELAACGKDVWLFRCLGGHARTIVSCCQRPPCPDEQRKRAARWVKRAAALWKRLPPTARHRWRLVTFGLRQPPWPVNLHAHPQVGYEHAQRWVGAVIAARSAFMRFLQRVSALRAAFGGSELSEDGYVHQHAVVYCEWLNREELQRWLAARDCTVPRCPHPSDDRCSACRAAKVERCEHADNGRQRCNGSWYVDIRELKSQRDLVEGLKYAAAPVNLASAARAGDATAAAERTLCYYAALFDRHRIETYGLAREKVKGDDQWSGQEPGRCPRCGLPEYLVLHGRDHGGAYTWRPFTSTPPAPSDTS